VHSGVGAMALSAENGVEELIGTAGRPGLIGGLRDDAQCAPPCGAVKLLGARANAFAPKRSAEHRRAETGVRFCGVNENPSPAACTRTHGQRQLLLVDDPSQIPRGTGLYVPPAR
jgi:hypothetical protein